MPIVLGLHGGPGQLFLELGIGSCEEAELTELHISRHQLAVVLNLRTQRGGRGGRGAEGGMRCGTQPVQGGRGGGEGTSMCGGYPPPTPHTSPTFAWNLRSSPSSCTRSKCFTPSTLIPTPPATPTCNLRSSPSSCTRSKCLALSSCRLAITSPSRFRPSLSDAWREAGGEGGGGGIHERDDGCHACSACSAYRVPVLSTDASTESPLSLCLPQPHPSHTDAHLQCRP